MFKNNLFIRFCIQQEKGFRDLMDLGSPFSVWRLPLHPPAHILSLRFFDLRTGKLFLVFPFKPPEHVDPVHRQAHPPFLLRVLFDLCRRMIGMQPLFMFRRIERAFEPDGFPAHNPLCHFRAETHRLANLLYL